MSSWQGHSSCRRGKRVRVVMKDGTVFIAKFIEKKPNQRIFFEDRIVRAGDIKSFTIVR